MGKLSSRQYITRQRRNGKFNMSIRSTVSKGSSGPLSSIGEQVNAGRERRYPADYREYITPGQSIYRGETRFVPEHVNTPSEIVDHLFSGDNSSIGKSWSLNKEVANTFANKNSMSMPNVPQPEGTYPVELLMHSKIDPKNVSFDGGRIKLPNGGTELWDNKGWKKRIYDGPNRPLGAYNEAEVLMKEQSNVPIHGVTIKHGEKLNSFQFDPPVVSTTDGRFVTRLVNGES